MFRAFAITCLVSFAFANPVAPNLVLHESRQDLPAGFIRNGAATKDIVLTLRAGLVQSNISGLEQELYAVSMPGSLRYGQHLTREEVEEYVKPSNVSVTLINQWLNENGISPKIISPAGDWLEFSVSVNKANELLNADFHVFTHTESGQQSIRTMSYSIPSNLKGHLDLVHPTITLASPFTFPAVTSSKKPYTSGAMATRDAVPVSCDSDITPTCLQDLYGIPSTLATQSSNVLGVSGFENQYAIYTDLQEFLTEYRPDLPSSTNFSFQSVDNGKNSPQNIPGLEANLDIQYTIGVASGVPVTFISVGSDSSGEFANELLDLVNFLLAESELPTVLTTSYGVNEDTVSSAVANQVCNAFMQLGARGTSVLFASGDGGVAGGHGVSCTTFVPVFPGGCPYLTSVGATTGINETAASFSSGGFSDIFTRPSYQSSAVSSYLTVLGNTNAGLYNTTGRGFPDVSAQGQNFSIVEGGYNITVDGTSCSSPTFASVISLLNDELIGAGKSPLGFLNPLLYSSASALNDITSGSNPGCNTTGFPAAPGWDPVTGLGTPNYAKLRTAANL